MMSVVYFPWYVFKIYVFFPIEKCGKQGVREKKHLLWTQVWYLRIQVLYVRTRRYTCVSVHTRVQSGFRDMLHF